ncbi:hypothetical protein [Psychrobacter alimentarius]|uniref:hypothetical protein n=1 Tax=Psychrobacter alimentarius TaxID=261164 RepID=UPI00191B38D8|nr:hypothetical protein [Psychrobacter alimentarius]
MSWKLDLSKRDRKEQECDALSEVTNFIAQEIYKLAVLKKYPKEYNKIFNLSQSIIKELTHLFGESILDLETLKATLVDLIVHGATDSDFERNVSSILKIDNINKLELDSFIDNSENTDNSDKPFDYEKHEHEVKVTAFNVTKQIFFKNKGFKTTITHKYPPSIIGYKYDYHEALEYYYGLYYHSQIDNKTNTMTFYHPPYRSFRPYIDRIIDQSKCIEQEFQVPTTALSRKEALTCSSSELLQSSCAMTLWRGQQPKESVIKTTEIRFRLDLSEPISNKELDRALAHLRSVISYAQYHNAGASMLLAETETELIQAYNIASLKCVEHTEFKRLHKVSIPKLDSPHQAKTYLCGLIVLFEHYVRVKSSSDSISFSWVKNEDGLTTLSRFSAVSIELSKTHGEEGFSAGSVEKGYKLVKAVFEKHISDFQFRRVQFNARLNTRQRDKLKGLDPVRLEDLHPNDVDKVKEEIEKLKKKGRQASVKAQINGSYIVTW